MKLLQPRKIQVSAIKFSDSASELSEITLAAQLGWLCLPCRVTPLPFQLPAQV